MAVTWCLSQAGAACGWGLLGGGEEKVKGGVSCSSEGSNTCTTTHTLCYAQLEFVNGAHGLKAWMPRAQVCAAFRYFQFPTAGKQGHLKIIIGISGAGDMTGLAF